MLPIGSIFFPLILTPFSMLKHSLSFKSCFDDMGTDILSLRVHLLQIV